MIVITRIIEFQGKTIATKEWVTGNLYIENIRYFKDEPFCITDYYIEQKDCYGSLIRHKIIPETIGQYTNVIGSNKQKIYDHDIVSNEKYQGEVYWNYDYNGWRIAAINAENKLFDTELNNTYKVINHKYEVLVGNQIQYN